MLGPAKSRRLDEPIAVSLEGLVPQDHFYRHLENKLDLRFVRDWTRGLYAERGRPSIDPIIFCKLQLVMFFEGIRSERQLIETASLPLAHRWYLGYALDEELPDDPAAEDERDGDSADPPPPGEDVVAPEGVLPLPQRVLLTAAAAAPERPPRRKLLQERRLDPHRPAVGCYRRTTDFRVSPTDPEATPMRTGSRTSLGYHDHYVVDGGKARIIVAALVTPADVMENVPLRDLLWRVRFRWKLWLRQVTGDTTYGTTENIIAVEDTGIRPISRCRTSSTGQLSTAVMRSPITPPKTSTAAHNSTRCYSRE